MLSLTIDGVEVKVGEGANLVEAAKAAGIDIPTYCHHPGLRAVGRCRMCVVEVDGASKLLPACSTRAEQGMEVNTRTERVLKAREAVLEFLLLHHPLDCPVCDQSGECALQDHVMDHAPDHCGTSDRKRGFPEFDGREIGPKVVQYQSRCIRCTRCARVAEEIFETNDLVMKERGGRIRVDTFDGRPFDNPWSVCTADVCPVGALTEKSSRLAARPWEVERTPSVCPGCSIGCSVWVDHADGTIQRVGPRFNPEVNAWWMCDHGRSVALERDRRDMERPTSRRGRETTFLTWDEGLDAVTEMISRIRPKVVASAYFSNEALYLIRRILVDHAGLEAVVPFEENSGRWVKNVRRQKITSSQAQPNLLGALKVGLKPVDGPELREFLTEGPVLLLHNRAHRWLETDEAAALAGGRIAAVFGRLHTPLSRAASLAFPAASWFENEGSRTSSTGRVQFARRVRPPGASARPMWRVMLNLATRLDPAFADLPSPGDVFDAMAGEVPAFAGMTYGRLWSEGGIPILEGANRAG